MATMLQAAFARYESLWTSNIEMPLYRPLDRDLVTDVVVVGAGMAGMSVAYHLVRAGLQVAVLEDGRIASGITRCTSAHLSCAMDNSYTVVESRRGDQITRVVAQSHLTAIDRIETITRAERIDCDFERVDAFLFLPPGETIQTLDEELGAVRRAGLTVSRLRRAPLDCFDTGPCIRFSDQAQFHPLKYIAGLARAIEREGGLLFTDTHVEEVSGGKKDARVSARGFTVTGRAVVVATHAPVNDRFAVILKQAPYTTYVIGARIPTGSVPHGLYWDMDDPYHYVRVHDIGAGTPHEVLMVGGEDHKTGQADDTERRHRKLEQWARHRFPMIDGIEFRWAGEVMESADGLAFIGRNPGRYDNVFIVTGDTGMGMTHSTIAGMLITDLVLDRPNPWEPVYDPARKPIKALPKFVKENINVARQYADWVLPGDPDTRDDILPGSGAVLRHGLKKIAVYRDAHGSLHEMSAVCPHLGCIVHWNPTERTWDCPCHGSRFGRLGDVINGPANKDLRPLD